MTGEALVLAFVRGEVDSSDLAALGVSIRCSESGCVVDEPEGVPVVSPSVADVAQGIVVNWARSTGLRDWARAVLAANFIDLSALEDGAEGEQVLDALWDASAGGIELDAVVDRLRVLTVARPGAGDG